MKNTFSHRDILDPKFKVSASNLFLFALMILLALLSSCWEKDLQRDLTVKNNSSDTICVLYTEIFPDTTLDCRLASVEINPHQENQLFLRNGWEKELLRIGVLQLFIIDKSIWETDSCDDIKKDNRF